MRSEISELRPPVHGLKLKLKLRLFRIRSSLDHTILTQFSHFNKFFKTSLLLFSRMSHLKYVKKIEQRRVKKLINFKKSSNPGKKRRWRVSISIKVLYSNDGY